MSESSSVTITAVEEVALDPFEISDTLTEINVVPKSVKELKNGSYLINFTSIEQLNAVLQVENLAGGTKVDVKLYEPRKGCKRVFTCPQVKDHAEQAMRDRLASQGVVAVEKRKATFFLTFNTTTPPETIKIGVLECRLSKFYRDPLICKNCFAVAHHEKQCRNKAACRKCSGYHGEGFCNRKPTCRNCKGNHMPTDKRCPLWIQEAAIIKLMVDKDLPGDKAREKYRAAHKRDYIVPPPVPREARKGPIAPTAQPDPTKPDPTKPEASAPPTPKKRAAAGAEKSKSKKRRQQREDTDRPEPAKSPKPSRRSLAKPKVTPKAPESEDEAAEDSETSLCPRKEYAEMLKLIYDSSEECDDDKAARAKAKARRRKTK